MKVFIIVFILFPVFFSKSYAESDYDLNFRKDIEITWEYAKVDDILINRIKFFFNSSLYCLNHSDNEEDSRFMNYIEDIEKSSDKWKVKISYKHNDNSHQNLKELKIYEDPGKIPIEWFYEINDLKLRYIPYRVNDYLDELIEGAPVIFNTSILKGSFSQLLIHRHSGNKTIIAELSYDNAGIIDKFKVKIDDKTAYYYKKIGIKTNGPHQDPLLMIILIIFAICISSWPLCLALLSYRKKSRLKNLTITDKNNKHLIDPRIRNLEFIDNKTSKKEPILIPGTENPNILGSKENSKTLYEKYELFEKDILFVENYNESKRKKSNLV